MVKRGRSAGSCRIGDRGYCSCSATELGKRLGDGFRLTEGKVKTCSQPNWLPGRSSLCVPKECLLELGAGIKHISCNVPIITEQQKVVNQMIIGCHDFIFTYIKN